MKWLLAYLLTVVCVAAQSLQTNTVTFTNRFGKTFANVRIEKADGESITWVSATNALVFGRIPTAQLTQETYQRLGVTDSEVVDAALARARAEQQKQIQASAAPAVPVARQKSPLISGRISLGMSGAEVEQALGAPNKKNRSVYDSGVHEQWVYGNSYVYLQQDKVTSWSESE